MTSTLLSSFDFLIRELKPHLGGDGIEIDDDNLGAIIDLLSTMRSQAAAMDDELAIIRLWEQSVDVSRGLERAATEVMTSPDVSRDGNVIAPLFGRKS